MSPDQALGLFLIDLAALIALGRLLGGLVKRLGQPSVIGELLVGILIGPSLLESVAPDLVAAMLPPETMTLLHGVGNVGLILFIFLIGLEVDQSAVRRRFDLVAKVAAGSFLLPFAAGALVAIPLFSAHSGGGESQLAFTLFIGAALACTAFPVLARILTDWRLEHTSLGTTALAAAGLLDLAGWTMVAAALAVAAGDGLGGVLWKLLLLLAFVVAVKTVAVPLLLRCLRDVAANALAAQLGILAVAVFAAAGTTQLIGLHSVIGPLVLGLLLPHRSLRERLGPVRSAFGPVTTGVLLPVYFATAGMSVDVSGFSGGDVLQLALLLVLATTTKILGTALGAKWAGLDRRGGLRLGILLNTRGVMEVVVLNIGLGAGLLDVTLYSQLMIVALLATAMTGPLIRRPRADSGQVLADLEPWRRTTPGVEPEATPRSAA